MRLILAVVATLATAPVLAEDPPFIDDRSTPRQVIASFYNAIERQEQARAYSYLGQYTAPADFEAWATPFYDVAEVDLLLGEPVTHTTAGSISYDLPVVAGFTDWHGAQRYEVGCIGVLYTLPHDAVPPYQSMYISGYRMQPATGTPRLPTCED